MNNRCAVSEAITWGEKLQSPFPSKRSRIIILTRWANATEPHFDTKDTKSYSRERERPIFSSFSTCKDDSKSKAHHCSPIASKRTGVFSTNRDISKVSKQLIMSQVAKPDTRVLTFHGPQVILRSTVAPRRIARPPSTALGSEFCQSRHRPKVMRKLHVVQHEHTPRRAQSGPT